MGAPRRAGPTDALTPRAGATAETVQADMVISEPRRAPAADRFEQHGSFSAVSVSFIRTSTNPHFLSLNVDPLGGFGPALLKVIPQTQTQGQLR